MNHTSFPPNKRTAGMTLIELTVAILVLLTLVSILFIGARAWKKGSDRSANIMNVRNIQQAVRGQQNVLERLPADTISTATLFGTNGYLNEPKPPVSGVSTYLYNSTYGNPGDLFVINYDLGAADGVYFYSSSELAAKTFDW